MMILPKCKIRWSIHYPNYCNNELSSGPFLILRSMAWRISLMLKLNTVTGHKPWVCPGDSKHFHCNIICSLSSSLKFTNDVFWGLCWFQVKENLQFFIFSREKRYMEARIISAWDIIVKKKGFVYTKPVILVWLSHIICQTSERSDGRSNDLTLSSCNWRSEHPGSS